MGVWERCEGLRADPGRQTVSCVLGLNVLPN